MHLLYITFGKKFSVHLQAAFSVCSFLAAKEAIQSINIITDAPEFYRHLGDKVTLIPVTAAQLEEWKGAHGFFWRIKIKAIQQLCERYTGEPVLYLDTDTFLYDQQATKSLFHNGKAIMHECEGPMSQAATKTEKRMWQQIGNKPFAGSPIPSTASMWNAGVVGIPNTTNGAECRYALQLCDDLCAAGVTRRLIEQFSLSVALEKYYGVQPADAFIGHYWSTKDEWEPVINRVFSEAYFKGATINDVIAQLAAFDFTQLPVKKLQKNTALRLNRLVGKLFQPKAVQYIKRLS
ncbi:MAG: hypothetical protein JWP88_2284 [Flaviaesturariibacter sp.]|nr:hypothetical protein [Flaviaesturariibacter sp.]